MSWIFEYGVSAFSVLCYIVFLNGICGWIGFGIWNCLKRIWEQNGQYKILYYCLKIVILLFILPLGWIMIASRNRMLGTNITYNWYPWVNPQIAVILTGIFVIWLIGASTNFREYILEKKYLQRLENMGEIVSVEERISGTLVPMIYVCSGICSPMVAGIIKKKLYLPKREYDILTREIIIEHELTHLRHHDLLYKNICAIVTVVYWFCPWVNYIFKEYDCWSEELCDMELCVGKNAKWMAKDYYSIILKEINGSNISKIKRCSALFESQNTIEWRITRMKHYYEKHKDTKLVSGILAFVLILMCPLTAYASGNVLEAGLRVAYANTMTYIEEDPNVFSDSTEEIVGELTGDEKIVEVQRQNIERIGESHEWTIEKGVMLVLSSYNLKAGDGVTITVNVTSGNGPINYGIKKGGTIRYMSTMKHDTHDFIIDKGGIYQIFVENKGNATIKVDCNIMMF